MKEDQKICTAVVNVGFHCTDGVPDETQFDVDAYDYYPTLDDISVEQLMTLWTGFVSENDIGDAEIDYIDIVDTYDTEEG